MEGALAKKPIGPVRRDFTPWESGNAKPFIEFRNVTKRFGDFTAVDNLSLTIYEREFFALLGGSGCGKTTMMRMLGGFEEPSAGEIFLDGQNLAGVPPYRRPANMMFQSYALFPHMSVERNIAFGLQQDKLPKGEIEARVQQMLKLVKLEDFAKRKPHQLSGGQRQRVALARSIAKKPKVLLLDEPLGALDRKLREETQFELMDLQTELGMTFLIVTHDQEEAMTVADRIAVMDRGRIIQVATPAEIYETPNSRFVADFIGSINLIEARVASRNGTVTRLKAPNLEREIAVSQPTDANVGDTVWFAIRPEKIRLGFDAPQNGTANAAEAEIWDIGYLGDVSIFHAKAAEDLILKSTVANITRTVERPISWEDNVWLSWDEDAGVILTR
ncbi:polyamine ABC transporter ATP-binding protein [Stappia sp. GBMRC 2046]|uniref:Spermidine/putrescine import ATP-binding protein PotA n=1 Tax=Stappia sediminis TaxID=2692190 RepID=A0A7X3LWA3_9HYPH|nr:polyamine ABC transporter ATP-binding protein [Stappia sediminis]